MKDRYDVVVIGGGGAGLCAAIAAKKEGASVLLVSKSPVGRANCTAFAGGGFRFAGPGVPWKRHFEETLATGKGINDPVLLELFAREGGMAVLGLNSDGMRMDVREMGVSVAGYAPGKLIGGYGMTTPLRKAAGRLGVEMLEQAAVSEILHDGGRVTGIAVVGLRDGRASTIACSAVVVATGGGGSTYRHTDNPRLTTGDGYRLLWKLGLAFRDMEFVQFYPLGVFEPHMPSWMIDLGIIDAVPMQDGSGREFMLDLLHQWGYRDGREGNLFARDRASIAIAQKWLDGDEVVLRSDLVDQALLKGTVLSSARPGFDPSKKPVHVRPLVHYMTGGVVIDSRCSTAMGGLYACGEVTGGIDGANRIGGNALTNITLFGTRAGRFAAEYALAHPSAFAPKPAQGLPQSGAGELPSALSRRLGILMDEQAGPVRSRASLEKAYAGAKEIAKMAEDARIPSPFELQTALELRSKLTTAQLIIEGALLREESRGVHFRSDFPMEREEFNRPILRTGDGRGDLI